MTLSKSFCLLWLVLLLGACAGQTKIESDLGIKKAPDWVNEGTQVVNDKKGRLIQGVGSAPNLGDDSLQLSVADGRARSEIAKALASYLDVVAKDYSNANSTEHGYIASSEIYRQINSLSKTVLRGSKIMGRWKDQKSGVVYSFAEMDLKSVEKMIQVSDKLNADLKKYILDNGSQLFDTYTLGNTP